MSQIIENNENIKTNEHIWKVYLHTVPKEISGYDWDKYYVGITKTIPERRWGKNGNGYKKQIFYRAIQKYGWNNIKHEILFENLSLEEANNKEKELIKKLDSKNSKHGYNVTFGGDNNKHLCKLLAQYDLDGNFIRVFNGLYEAEEIYGNVDAYAQTSKGFMWKYIEETNNIPLKIDAYKNPFLSEPLEQYDLHGNYIKTFTSHLEAEKYYPRISVNRNDRNICTSYGFQWKYQSSDKTIVDISNAKKITNKVYVYNLDGTFVECFNNKKEALRTLLYDKKESNIPSYVFDNIYNNYYYGYRWTREYYEKLPELICTDRHSKPIIQINPYDNKILNIYPSASVAESTFENKSKNPHSINESCRTKGNQKAHGFIWRYFEDYEVEESSIDDSFLLQKYNIYKNIIEAKKRRSKNGN